MPSPAWADVCRTGLPCLEGCIIGSSAFRSPCPMECVLCKTAWGVFGSEEHSYVEGSIPVSNPCASTDCWVTRQMSCLASEPHFLTCKIDIKQQKPFERIHLENAYGGLPVCIFPPLLGSDLPAVMRRQCDFGGPEEARRVALKSFPRE